MTYAAALLQVLTDVRRLQMKHGGMASVHPTCVYWPEGAPPSPMPSDSEAWENHLRMLAVKDAVGTGLLAWKQDSRLIRRDGEVATGVSEYGLGIAGPGLTLLESAENLDSLATIEEAGTEEREPDPPAVPMKWRDLLNSAGSVASVIALLLTIYEKYSSTK